MIARNFTSNYFTTSSGTNLHYLQGGDSSGPLLVCLHGLGGSTETFLPLVPFLPQDFSIVLVDFQGFGKTPLAKPQEKISIAKHVSDLGDLITSLQGYSGLSASSKVIVVGHSLGAIIALHYGAQHPEVFGGLLLIGPGRAAGHITAARRRMLDLAATVRQRGIQVAADAASVSNFYENTQGRAVDELARVVVRDQVSASDPEAYAQTCEAIVDLEHEDPPYEKITCPTVFVAGDMDLISPVQRSMDLSTLVGGDSSVEVVKSGHQPMLEDLPGVIKALEKLLLAIKI